MSRPEVVVVSYDPTWPRRFEEERDRLWRALPDVLVHIEHIGGTAVPGCPPSPRAQPARPARLPAPKLAGRGRYARCKQDLALLHHDDRAAYTQGKAALLLELLNEARRSAGLPQIAEVWEGTKP